MLRYGYLETSAEPWVLLWGNQNDMLFLADLLRKIPTVGTGRALADLGCHAQTGETVLLKYCEIGAQGMRNVEGKENAFVWELDRDHVNLFVEMVEVLASSGHGHQYLEYELGAEITVRVSCNEYPDDFLIE
jgi:hypothetical protein